MSEGQWHWIFVAVWPKEAQLFLWSGHQNPMYTLDYIWQPSDKGRIAKGYSPSCFALNIYQTIQKSSNILIQESLKNCFFFFKLLWKRTLLHTHPPCRLSPCVNFLTITPLSPHKEKGQCLSDTFLRLSLFLAVYMYCRYDANKSFYSPYNQFLFSLFLNRWYQHERNQQTGNI